MRNGNVGPHITAFLAVMCFYTLSFAQVSDTVPRHPFWQKAPAYNPVRGRLVGFTALGGYTLGMSALYSAWYRDYPSSKFHLFYDGKEWLQMDKIGHAGSSYYISRWSSSLVEWTGLPSKKASLLGTGFATAFMITIEMFDGFSSEWGFSPGDIIANTTGAGVFLGQELLWQEQRVSFKFSYTEDPLVNKRPSIFGSSFIEHSLKDYNGQTYWLSFNLSSFMKQAGIPPWLNIAAGYGAGNMLTAKEGVVVDGISDPGKRFRQFYLSPDIEWSKIPVKSGALKTLFKVIGFIKFPAPSLEYRSNGSWVFHGLHF